GLFHVLNHCINCGSCHNECPSQVNIPRMVMAAKADYAKKFGPALTDRLLTSADTAARLTGGNSQLVMPLVDNSFFKQAGEKLLGMKVYVPTTHCCGLPMLSKGMTGKSISAIEKNLKQWGNMVKRVDHIAVTCSTCGLALKSKWQYLNQTSIVREVAKKTIHGTSLIQNHMHGLTLKETSRKVAYHTPCHLKVQPEAASSIGMLKALPGIEVNPLECHCCGMAGTWGMMAKNFNLSQKIGSGLIQKLNSSGADTGATDCPTCTMQMQAFSNKPVIHPVEILAQCL
ncbi:MAG: oxidoreductase, partial [Desulfobacteraceae bacterium]|nr:oxidoreductase [Desulfobacteraceae bacterium]